jgi:hypothetical protein
MQTGFTESSQVLAILPAIYIEAVEIIDNGGSKMKVTKVLWTVLLVGLVIGAGVTAATAFAQDDNPPAFNMAAEDQPFLGRGPGRGPVSRMPLEDGDHPLHDYLVAELADALELGESELESRLEDGETMMDIILSTGMSQEDAWDLMGTLHQAALEAAEADGIEFPMYGTRPGTPMGEFYGDCPMADENPMGYGRFGMHGFARTDTPE